MAAADRDITGPDHPSSNGTRESNLNRTRAADNVNISPDLFEKLYLNPPTAVDGNLRNMIGNPTPM